MNDPWSFARNQVGCFFLEIERGCSLVCGSYATNSVKLEDKDKNLKRRMYGELVEKCRPGALGGYGRYGPAPTATTPLSQLRELQAIGFD